MVEFLTPQIRDGLRIFDFLTYRSTVASRLRALGRKEETENEIIAAEKEEEKAVTSQEQDQDKLQRALLIREYKQRADVFVQKLCEGKAPACQVDVRTKGVNINTAGLDQFGYEIVSVLSRTMLQKHADSTDLDALLAMDDRDIRNAFYIKKNLFKTVLAQQGTDITIDMVFPNFFSYVDNVFPSGNPALASTVYIALDPSRPPRFHPNGVVAEISVKGISVPRSTFGGREAVNGVDQIFFTPEGRVQEIVFNSGADYAINVGSVVFRNPKKILLEEDANRPGRASICALVISEDIKLQNGTMLKADDLVHIDGKNSKIVKYKRGVETIELNLDVAENEGLDAPPLPESQPAEAPAPPAQIVIEGLEIGKFEFEAPPEISATNKNSKIGILAKDASITINGVNIPLPKGSRLHFYNDELISVKCNDYLFTPPIPIGGKTYIFDLYQGISFTRGIEGRLKEPAMFEMFGKQVKMDEITLSPEGEAIGGQLTEEATFMFLPYIFVGPSRIRPGFAVFDGFEGGVYLDRKGPLLKTSKAFSFYVHFDPSKEPTQEGFFDSISVGLIRDEENAKINGKKVKSSDRFVVRDGKLVKVAPEEVKKK